MKNITLLILGLVLAACGRYGDPLAPEMYSPTEVKDLSVSADSLGVRFEWTAPKKDQRGEELKQIDGYVIYRKQVNDFARVLEDQGKFEKLAFLPDTHIIERDRLRAEARASGKVARRIEADPEKMKFTYQDTQVQPGNNYLYKIVPVSDGDVEGLVKNYIKLRFVGAGSNIIVDESPESNPGLDLFYLKG